MNSKRAITLILVMFMMVGLLIGCGTEKGSEQNKSADKDNTEAEKTNDTEPEEKEKSQTQSTELKGKISLWGGAHLTNITEIALESFSEKNPDVEFTFEKYPFAEYPTKMRLQLSAGDSDPNIMIIHDFLCDQFMKAGWLEDISDRIPKDKLIQSYQNIMNDGKTYGVMMQQSFLAFYYRSDIFNKLGLNPPTNYDEYIKVAKELKNNGYFIDAFNPSDNNNAKDSFKNYLYPAGGGIFDSEGNVMLDNGKAVETLNKLKAINDLGVFSPDVSDEALWTAINDSKIVARLAPTYYAAYFESNLDPEGKGGYGSWKMVAAPNMFNNALDNYQASSTYYVINSKAPDKELAWKVIEFLACSVEGGRALSEINREGTMAKIVNGYIPSIESIAKDSRSWDVFGGQKVTSDIAKIFLKYKDNAVVAYKDLRTSEAENIVAQMINDFFSNKGTAEDVVNDAAKKIRALNQ